MARRRRGWDSAESRRIADALMPSTDNIDQLAAAFVAFSAEMPAVKKDSENPFFKSKYADLADVVKVAAPILAKNGLAVSQFVSHDEDRNTLVTYLLHSSGQYIVDEMLLMLPNDNPQGQGSAITYARRYAYQATLGIVADDDDDGQQASSGANTSTRGGVVGSGSKGRQGPPVCPLCNEQALQDVKPYEGGYAHGACIAAEAKAVDSEDRGDGPASQMSADGSGKDVPASTPVSAQSSDALAGRA